jgi:small-conductance mechanosensitive channel
MALQSLSSITDWLITNNQPDNYDKVASDWLIALIVIAFIWMIVMLLMEIYRKWRSVSQDGKIWGTGKILIWMLIGFAPVLLSVITVYWYSLDFQTVVERPGLLKGVFVGWLLYVFMFLVSHLFGNLRRDLFHR